jgi:DNA-binding beta-propeller fold protein YncE
MREFGLTSRQASGARCLAFICALAFLLVYGAPTAQAQRALIKAPYLSEIETKRAPGGQIEGACGIALWNGNTYVSDYYHHTIDIFPNSGRITGNPLDGYCGLAFAPDGALYANEWHEAVYRVLPSKQLIDSSESTGVAVDQASGDVYVNDRTYVARYEAPIAESEPPAQLIGLGSLGEGYGVAVEAGRLYVPDAATDTVKVYEPTTDPVNPVQVIEPPGGFTSLRDAAITTDPTNGHVLVLDNLQPGFEFPEGAVEEFGSGGGFLGGLSKRVIDGEPSGLAVVADEPPDPLVNEGDLFVTTGNSEESNAFHFGPYVSSLASPAAPLASDSAPTSGDDDGVGGTGEPAAPASTTTSRLNPKGKRALKRAKRHHRRHLGDQRGTAHRKEAHG